MAGIRAQLSVGAVQTGTRHVIQDGAEFLVAPVVAVKEGVLNGEFFKAEVVERNLQEWEGLPVTINHPPKWEQRSNSTTHAWVAANEIGTMRNVRVSQRSLKGELWLPIDDISGNAVEIAKRLESGSMLEVSIGFFSLCKPDSGVHQGTAFHEVTSEASPNHLALLPGEIGACSIEAGCGTPRVAKQHVEGLAHLPTFEGVELLPWQQVDHSLAGFIRAANIVLSLSVRESATVPDLPVEMRSWIASRTLLGTASGSTEAELLRVPVVNPETGRLNRGAVMTATGHKAARMPIAEATKKAARVLSVQLLKEEFQVGVDTSQAQNQAHGKLCGKRLAAVLSKAVDERSTNAQERTALLARMATAADISAERLEKIFTAQEDLTEDRHLRSFAGVLEIPVGLLFVAAGDDVDEFMRSVESPTAGGLLFQAVSAFQRWTGFNKNDNGGNKMNRCDMVAKVKAAAKLSDEQAKSLEGLDDAALQMFANGAGVKIGEDDDAAALAASNKAAADKAAADKVDADAKAVAAAKAASTGAPAGVTAAQVAEIVTGALKTFKDEQAVEREAEERTALTPKVKAAHPSMTDETLAATPMVALRALAPEQKAAPKVAAFIGAAGGVETEELDGEAQLKFLADVPNPYNAKKIEAAQKQFRANPRLN